MICTDALIPQQRAMAYAMRHAVPVTQGGCVGKPKQVGAIEIDQDLDHARTLWPVQRAGWVVMLLLAELSRGARGGKRATSEPESVESRGDVLVYTFVTAAPSRPTRITLNVRPEGYWSQRASAGIDGGGVVSFRQFIYP